MFDVICQFEEDILLFIQEYIRCDALTPVMKFFSLICEYGIIWIIIGVLMFSFKDSRKTGVMIFTALILSLIINNLILKNVVGRARPFDIIEGLTSIIAKPTDFSFPSGHTGVSFSAAFVIIRSRPPRYWIPALIVAAVTAFSRLYLGVHYPGDVAAGIIIGYFIALVSDYIVSACLKHDV